MFDSLFKQISEMINQYYEYIQFRELFSKGKTKYFECINNKSSNRLGIIKWYGPWRQYCFFPEPGTIFSKGCLFDIYNFIEELMNDRKNK